MIVLDEMLYAYTATIIECAQALLGESDGPLSDKQYEIMKRIIANAERFIHIFAEYQALPLDTLVTTRTLRHEFGTPLTPITGYSELLIMGVLGALNEKQMEHVQRICETTNQLRLAVEMIVNEARRLTAQTV
jgi:signal transduction histidine kinase